MFSILAEVMLVLPAVAVVFGIIGISQKSLHTWDVHEIVWMKPWAVSAFMFLSSLLFLPAPLLFAFVPHRPGEFAFLMIDFATIGLGLFLLRFASAQHLRFDLSRRTYLYSERLLFYVRSVSGDFEDIDSVYVTRGRNASCVRIAWKRGSPMRRLGMLNPRLELGLSLSNAEKLAAKLKRVLGVPIVSKPW